jgi:hypothetical protein
MGRKDQLKETEHPKWAERLSDTQSNVSQVIENINNNSRYW